MQRFCVPFPRNLEHGVARGRYVGDIREGEWLFELEPPLSRHLQGGCLGRAQIKALFARTFHSTITNDIETMPANSSGPDPRTARIVARVRAIPAGFVRTYGDIDPKAP